MGNEQVFTLEEVNKERLQPYCLPSSVRLLTSAKARLHALPSATESDHALYHSLGTCNPQESANKLFPCETKRKR